MSKASAEAGPGPVVLVGPMGAGKTVVGRRVADRLGRRFVDLDQVVEAATGATVAEVFAAEGEAGFRARESAALVATLGDGTATVIATGGGAVLTSLNRRVLRSADVVVWLTAEPSVLVDRLGAGAGDERPLLAGDEALVDRLARLDAERHGFYAEVATAVLDVGHGDADEIADAVVALVEAAAVGVGESGAAG